VQIIWTSFHLCPQGSLHLGLMHEQFPNPEEGMQVGKHSHISWGLLTFRIQRDGRIWLASTRLKDHKVKNWQLLHILEMSANKVTLTHNFLRVEGQPGAAALCPLELTWGSDGEQSCHGLLPILCVTVNIIYSAPWHGSNGRSDQLSTMSGFKK
jgi:hypothetical protein